LIACIAGFTVLIIGPACEAYAPRVADPVEAQADEAPVRIERERTGELRAAAVVVAG